MNVHPYGNEVEIYTSRIVISGIKIKHYSPPSPPSLLLLHFVTSTLTPVSPYNTLEKTCQLDKITDVFLAS